MTTGGRLAALAERYHNNRKALLVIVYIALFLDNMLLTTVVPIIPEYLLRISHPNEADIILNASSIQQPVARFRRQISWDDAWEQPVPGGRDPLNAPKRKITSPRRNRMRPTYSPTTGEPPFGGDDNENDAPRRPAALSTLSTERRHAAIADENVHVGIMFGSKAIIQLITNPCIGPLTNQIGYTVPMFTGFVIMFLSTLLFAFGASYGTLWLARALQGVGSACTSTSGMGMLAQAYTDDEERGSVMGIALGGLALGVMVGPPYGGIMYQWFGKELPFILLALLALLDGAMQFAVLRPHVDRGEPEGSTIRQLAKDPYIVAAAGAITVGNLGIAMLEPSLPLWMMETWGAGSFERGAAFIPASVSYMLGTNIFGPLAHRIGRWLSAMIGMIVIGFCLLMIPSARSVGGLIIPHGFMGFSIGMIDASMFPLMGWLVDLRHVGVYGSIYAIADAAFCFAFAIGPFISGPLVRSLGFPTMMYIIAIINFAYAPAMLLLRNPPARDLKQANGNGTITTTPASVQPSAVEPPVSYQTIVGVDSFAKSAINNNFGNFNNNNNNNSVPPSYQYDY